MGLLTERVSTGAAGTAAPRAAAGEAFSTFAKEGGRVGSGSRGSGQGGMAGCPC